MRTIITGILAASFVIGLAATAEAARKSKSPRYGNDGYTHRYPLATQRQRENARAYDRGGYYETDSNAFPPGSRGWWAMKERESGGDSRP